MAAVTYHMLCDTVSHEIKSFSEENVWPSPPAGTEVRSASFSSNAGDSPDVLKANPYVGGTFQEPSTYSDPAKPCFKIEWSGTGAVDGDDSVWEASVGSGTITITIKKWDQLSNQLISDSGDDFGVCVVGGLEPSKGRLSLASGQDSFTFDLTSAPRGVFDVMIIPINNTLPPKTDNSIRVRLI